jgi:hypothetical protein
MKSLNHLLAGVIGIFMLLTQSIFAQTNAYDDAYHYTKTTWITNGLNDGFGFGPWVLTTSGPSSHGFFTTRSATPLPPISTITNYANTNGVGPGFGSAPGNDGNAHVWGLFANGTGANSAVAYRGFSNSIPTNYVFKMQWESLGIGNNSTNLGGFFLRNGNSTNGTSDFQTGYRFAFYYIGGGNNSYTYLDNNGPQYINIPFGNGQVQVEFTLETADTYRLVVKALTNTSVIYAILDNQPLGGTPGSTIDSVALFANETSGNQNFNRMQIVSASLIPPTIVNTQPTNGSIYVNPASTNVSFEVDSLASTINPSGVTLLLNGVTVAQTNLSFNTNGPTSQLLVTNNGTLTGNLVYTATVIASDANGNKATNSFGFNTFLQTDNFIEAEDYNFNGGQFMTNAFPDAYDGYASDSGVSGIDYLDLSGLANNVYRPSDNTQILAGNDSLDHAGYASGGYSDFYVGYNETGEWEDYTRIMPSNTFTIYARMAGFGTSPTMEMERLASATASSSNQPDAALGRFNCPSTGGVSNYTLVPLTDAFGNTVLVNFPGTNTFRCTAVGGNRSYNFNYLILVPNSSTNTLRPYLSVVSPANGATGVQLDNAISFTIANRQTTVNPANFQLLVNSSNVTSQATIANNAAGTAVTYVPSGYLAPNTTYTIVAIYTDSGSVTNTNTWQFSTINTTITVIPTADALPIGSGVTNGFAETIYKVDDTAPTLSTLANAEQEIAGQRINTNTALPYPNLDPGPYGNGYNLETNTVNYDIQGIPTGTPMFPYKSAFPYVAAGTVNNNIALQALMYVPLNAGLYHFAVRSDDGFKLTAGPTATDTNLVLGVFDGGRGNGAASDIYFQVLTNGVYPMRLLYFQAGSGGNVEFYSVLNNGTTPVLVNDPSNSMSIKVYASVVAPALPVTILHPVHSGNTTTFSFVTQSGHTHYVEYTTSLNPTSWTLLQTIVGDGTTANVSDTSASGAARYYRVRSR